MFSGGSSACKRKQNQWKQRIPFVCCKQSENCDFHLFAANGKWKRQTPVCLLQMETENGSVYFLVSKR
jgi:hypothetical protein